MRLVDADALKEPIELQRASYARIGATERAEAYANCLWEIAQAPTVGGWVSVKDRLPEDGVDVLVWDDGGFAYIDTWIGHTWKFGGDFGVTHWMPLPTAPEPPEEVSGDG